MYADGTGLLTVAIHDGQGVGALPSRCRGNQWEVSGEHSHSDERLRARITVAGQWRILTALPEHFIALQNKFRRRELVDDSPAAGLEQYLLVCGI